MTNFTTKLMIAAAAMAVAACAASAQNLKAEIPFTFRVNGAVMAPGMYSVTISYGKIGVPMLYLHTWEGNHAALARAESPHDVPRAWQAAGSPVLSFECGGSVCALVDAWGGYGQPAFHFSTPWLGRDEPVRKAVVVMRPVAGD